MEITIKIECETINEFYTHLTELQRQIKKKTKREKLNPFNDEFTNGNRLSDDNCYGEHSVEITETTI